MESADLPPLGAFDMIGKDRRRAWSALGKMTKEESMQQFAESVAEFMPQFKSHLEETKAQREQSRIKEVEALKRAAEEESRKAAEAEAEKLAEQERLRDEEQRRRIRDALNRQTFTQFKAYAEQQYPSDPDRQAVLVKQLQEQHYRQYMQQVYQQQMESQAGQCLADNSSSSSTTTMTEMYAQIPVEDPAAAAAAGSVSQVTEQLASLTTADESSSQQHQLQQTVEEEDHECSDEYYCDEDDVPPANMWTKKEIQDFKLAIKSEGGDSVLSIGHGETVTVRVPTHAEGSALFWEFATDSYDVAFGVFFEWTDTDEKEISVHVSDSEDEDLDEYEDENGDPETGATAALVDKGPPTSVIIPIYRRDCHEEVYAGTHAYPGKGVYLLKFDNTYSLWR